MEALILDDSRPVRAMRRGLVCDVRAGARVIAVNDHMLRALKATEYPVIGFTLSDYELARVENGQSVQLTGELSLGGTRKSVVIHAIATEGPNGTLRVAGTYEIRMTEFGLNPPSLMLGTIKVNDRRSRKNVAPNFCQPPTYSGTSQVLRNELNL